jgi:hypothetical protein
MKSIHSSLFNEVQSMNEHCSLGTFRCEPSTLVSRVADVTLPMSGYRPSKQ